MYYIDCQSIADCLGISARAVRKRAAGWEGGRKRSGRGGGIEYPLEALPVEWQAKILQQMGGEQRAEILDQQWGGSPAEQPEPAPDDVRAGAGDQPASLPARSPAPRRTGVRRLRRNPSGLPLSERCDAKLEILKAFQGFCGGRSTLTRADDFGAAYAAGEIEVGEVARKLYPEVKRSTLALWLKRLREAGPNGLEDGRSLREQPKAIVGEVEDFVTGLVVAAPHLSTTQILEALEHKFDKAPSYSTVARWLGDLRKSEAFVAATAPDRWKAKYMAAFGSQSLAVERPNQRWELDSTPADILLTDGRYSIIGAIDVYSRRLKLLVAKTSKAEAVCLLLRRCLLDWGVPETVKTDNGADYTSKHVTRALTGLEVSQELCPPFQPWHKPHIERAFRTFSHGLLELMPGFAGHNVAERQALRDSQSFADRLFKRGKSFELRVSADELQEFCDRWLAKYEHESHQGIGGETPWQRWHEHPAPLRTIADERQLDILLAAAPKGDGVRTVSKQGVAFDRAHFQSADLVGWIGQQVRVLYDAADMGRCYVFTLQNEFICIAKCYERLGANPQEMAQEATKRQREKVGAERRRLRQLAKQVRPEQIAEEILADRQRKAGQLVPMPRVNVAHEVAALSEAGRAIEALHAKPREMSEAERLERQRAKEELLAQEAVEQPKQEIDLLRLAPRLVRQWRGGEAPDPLEREYLAHWIALPEGIGAVAAHLSDVELRQFRRWLQGEADVAFGG